MNQIKVVMLGASLDQNGGIATLEKLMIKHAPPEVNIQHFTSHDEGSILHRVTVFANAWSGLLGKLWRKQADIVHIHISDGGSLLRKAILTLTARAFKIPVVMHANGAEFHTTYANLPQWVQQSLAWMFRQCNYFLPVTSLWRDYYISTLGLSTDRMVVLPNPAEIPDCMPQRVNSAQVKFAFCGRVGQRKGTFDLIQAFAQLPAEVKSRAELVIAGDGELEQAYELVKELNVTDRITLLGWINAEKRDRLLAEADVFILPSYNEGLPLALMEAMGWGLPVITTPVSGIPDVVTSHENGLLVEPGNLQQITEAMQLLVEDESLRLAFGKAARERVIPLDIKVFYKHLTQIYHELQPSARLGETE